jgi:hypothetical protein
MSRIVSFYTGASPDSHGRTIDTIWSFDDDRLEGVHNYIQLLFPLQTPSQFVNAPLLDQWTIRAFHDRTDLRDRLLTSFDVMLRFYGLRREGDRVVRAADFEPKAANWLTPYNHNYLRITRILISLKALGLGVWSRAFFDCLDSIYEEHPDAIGLETYRYWQDAVG